MCVKKYCLLKDGCNTTLVMIRMAKRIDFFYSKTTTTIDLTHILLASLAKLVLEYSAKDDSQPHCI